MRRNIIIGGMSVALVGVAAALASLLVVPSLNRWRAGAERLEQLAEAIAGRERILLEDRAFQERLAEVSAFQESVAAFLPSEKDPEGIINLMTGSAGSRGVVLEEVSFPVEETPAAVSFGGALAAAPPQSFRVVLKASGSYQALRTFFGALAESARLLDIRSLTVRAEEGSDLLRAEAEFFAYYRPR